MKKDKKVELKTRNNLEVKTIVYKRIRVSIMVDYDKMQASIVERTRDGDYTPKNLRFTERSVGFMNPWKDILEAHSIAVDECHRLLQIEEDLKLQDMLMFEKEVLAQEAKK